MTAVRRRPRKFSARIMENAFDYLDAPVSACRKRMLPVLCAANLEKLTLPSVAGIITAIAGAVSYR